MADSMSVTLLIPAVMTGIAALAIMHVFGSLVRNEADLHDLRRRVKDLQYGQSIRVAKLKGMIVDEPDVEIVEEGIEQGGFADDVQEPELIEESTPASAA
jgi:hypothetical protein